MTCCIIPVEILCTDLQTEVLSHFVPLLAPHSAVIVYMVINGLEFSTGWLWAWTCSGCCTGQDELLSILETSSLLYLSWCTAFALLTNWSLPGWSHWEHKPKEKAAPERWITMIHGGQRGFHTGNLAANSISVVLNMPTVLRYLVWLRDWFYHQTQNGFEDGKPVRRRTKKCKTEC